MFLYCFCFVVAIRSNLDSLSLFMSSVNIYLHIFQIILKPL
jgi:hypothetical protein